MVLSQGPSALDRDAVEAICRARKDIKVLTDLELPVLREVFRQAKMVIAPSTGPLHLAHHVGTRYASGLRAVSKPARGALGTLGWDRGEYGSGSRCGVPGDATSVSGPGVRTIFAWNG